MKSKVNLNTASRFLETLAPGCDEFVFQTFADDGSGQLAKVLKGSLEDFAPALQKLNAKGAGIYVTINATKGEGRKASNFLRARALWADMDEGGDVKWPLEPSMIVETSPGKQHVYWLLTQESMDAETWKGCMAHIAAKYGADRKATDATRVLRLPGFFHCKGEPVQVRLIHVTKKRYSAAQIVKAFPPVAKTQKKQGAVTISGRVDVAELEDALRHLSGVPHPRSEAGECYADDYDTWVRFGLAIKRGLGDRGFSVWDRWARTSSRYPGREASRAKWDGFKTEQQAGVDPITVGTIYHCARRHGWSFGRFRAIAALHRGIDEIRAERGLA